MLQCDVSLSRGRFSFAFVAVAVAASCTVDDVDLSGKRCPCSAGYVCDAPTQRCFAGRAPALSAVDAATTQPIAFQVPARLRVARGGHVSLEVIAVVAPPLEPFAATLRGLPSTLPFDPPLLQMTSERGTFDIRAALDAPLGETSFVVHAFRATDDGGVDREVIVEVTPQPGSIDESFGSGGVAVADMSVHVRPAGLDDGFAVCNRLGDEAADVIAFDDVMARRSSFGQGGAFHWPASCDALLFGNGKLVVVGGAQRNGTTSQYDAIAIQRLDGNGQADPDWNGGKLALFSFGSSHVVSAAALQSDGSVLVVVKVDGAESRLVRMGPTGARDDTFGSNGAVTISNDPGSWFTSVIVLPNGTSLVGGTANRFVLPPVTTVRALTASGTPATSFGQGGTAVVTHPGGWFDASDFFASGDALIGLGLAYPATNTPASGSRSFRLDATGALDPGYGNAGVAEWPRTRFASGLHLAEGDLLLGSDARQLVVVRTNQAGALDPTFANVGRDVGANVVALGLVARANHIFALGRTTVAPSDGGATASALVGTRLWR